MMRRNSPSPANSKYGVIITTLKALINVASDSRLYSMPVEYERLSLTNVFGDNGYPRLPGDVPILADTSNWRWAFRRQSRS